MGSRLPQRFSMGALASLLSSFGAGVDSIARMRKWAISWSVTVRRRTASPARPDSPVLLDQVCALVRDHLRVKRSGHR